MINSTAILLFSAIQAGMLVGLANGEQAGQFPKASRTFSAFVAFDNGVGLNDPAWTPERQAQLLKKLGFDGIGYTGIDDLDRRLAAFDRARLTVFSLYYDFVKTQQPENATTFDAALKRLADNGIDLWMPISKTKQNEESLIEQIRRIADRYKKNGGRVVLYPHYGSRIPTARSALQLVRKIDHPNVGLAINLCHELKSGKGKELVGTINACGPHIFMVSIHGADRHSNEWPKLIQPLDQGDFDLRPLLRQLKAIGYIGPIGLQCFGISDEPPEHLSHSIQAWHRLLNESKNNQD